MVVFLCMQLVPGDIAKALLGPLATQETVEEFRRYLGLDRPIPEQYVNWLWAAPCTAIWAAPSPATCRSPSSSPTALRNSAILLGGALIIAIPLGIAVGLISAIRRDSRHSTTLSMGATLIAANIPTFVFGLGLVIIFAVQLKWFPVQGMV